jgi:hypothetical protein
MAGELVVRWGAAGDRRGWRGASGWRRGRFCTGPQKKKWNASARPGTFLLLFLDLTFGADIKFNTQLSLRRRKERIHIAPH